MDILFFSRGKGRGHAIPDTMIARDLCILEPLVEITFVSYSIGADTFLRAGCNVINVNLPEDPSPWDVVVVAIKILRDRRPAIVISHEEFSVIPVARAFGFPVIFLTDWFPNSQSFPGQALNYVNEIIFLDDPGYYDVPEALTTKIFYVGPVLRSLPDNVDKACSRSKLGIPSEATVLLGAPGSAIFHSESRAPIFDLVVSAYNMLEIATKRLVWVAAECDYESLCMRSKGRDDILIMRPHDDFITTMMAADLVITKGNRISVLESQALAIPSISIAFGNNPIDEWRVARVPSNFALRAGGLTKDSLKHYMLRALGGASDIQKMPTELVAARAMAAARRVQAHLRGTSAAHTAQ